MKGTVSSDPVPFILTTGGTVMAWMTKYSNITEFLSFFTDEQDYVDAMFVQIVMFNFGVYMDQSMLHTDEV